VKWTYAQRGEFICISYFYFRTYAQLVDAVFCVQAHHVTRIFERDAQDSVQERRPRRRQGRQRRGGGRGESTQTNGVPRK
jgi:hypothetical protein